MFLRKKNNKSGTVSVQLVDKSSGRYKLAKTIGSSSDPTQIDVLVAEGERLIRQKLGILEMDFANERKVAEGLLNNIEQISVIGTELLLGKIFDEVGFNQIQDALFRKLVIARLCFPASKLKTTEYLSRYRFEEISVQNVYRYLDKLHNTQKDTVQQISYKHTLQVLGNKISLVFYDVTTLYFETNNEDGLRKTGFSKDGKHQHPQIVLGLLVSTDGYPLAYDIFEGNKFEGHTMLPVIDGFKTKYGVDKLVIVADSGLLSADNIKELQGKGQEFILGARIKNEKQAVQDKILEMKLKDGESQVIKKDEQINLIISYSKAREKKDKANRQRGLEKLQRQIQSGRLTKSNINNRGYNKYLKMEGEIKVTIDKEKYDQDSKWDGLKGYLTNTMFSKEEVMVNYKQLWKIEKAFRIVKTDLRIRPIFHRLQRRIEAHLCIAFVAYKIYKELERQLKEKKSDLSPEKAVEIAKTIYFIKIITPTTKDVISKILYLNDEQRHLANLFNF